MRNAQNLQLAQLQPFPAIAPMPPNMLQLAQIQQPFRQPRIGAFLPQFTPPVLPSPMIPGGLTPGVIYPNVAYPNYFAQPHCPHQQGHSCHHHDSDNQYGSRGRHRCSGSHGHSNLDSPFNPGSRSRSRPRSRTRRSRSRSPSFRSSSSRVQIIGNRDRNYPFYSTSGSSLHIAVKDNTSYSRGSRDSTLKILLSASIADIWECLDMFVGGPKNYNVHIRRIDGRLVPLDEVNSASDLRTYENVIDCFILTDY